MPTLLFPSTPLIERLVEGLRIFIPDPVVPVERIERLDEEGGAL